MDKVVEGIVYVFFVKTKICHIDYPETPFLITLKILSLYQKTATKIGVFKHHPIKETLSIFFINCHVNGMALLLM